MAELCLVYAQQQDLVNTDVCFQANQEGFSRLTEHIPKFSVPYLVLENNRFEIVRNPGLLAIFYGEIFDDGRTGFRNQLPLDQFIDGCVAGTEFPGIDSIHIILEWSPKEMYPEVMKQLEERHDITRTYLADLIAAYPIKDEPQE